MAAQIEDTLIAMGYSEFDFVDDEEGALKAARANCPDLITADQRLVSGTGVGAVREVCAEHGDIPTVYITEFREEVRNSHPDAIIVHKPFGPRSLQDAIAEAIVRCRKLANAS